MNEQIHHYRAFLLRLWLAGNGDAPEWRVTIEDIVSHERRTFENIADLVGFLQILVQSGIQRTAHSHTDTTAS